MSLQEGSWRPRRYVALIVGLVLAVGVAACGSDDGSDDGTNAAAERQDARVQQSAGVLGDAKPGTPQDEIASVYVKHVDAYYTGAPKTVCETMTRAARAAVAGKGTCEQWVKSTLSGGDISPNRPYIVKLDLRGDRASALVKTKNSQRYPLTFVKEDGEWRVSPK